MPTAFTSLFFREFSSFITAHTTERAFREHFGCPSIAIDVLWNWLLQRCSSFLPPRWSIHDFLWSLLWLKSPGSNLSIFASRWRIDRHTMVKRIQMTLVLIDFTLPPLSLADRWLNWRIHVLSSVIATTTFLIEQPREQSWYYLVERNTFGVKYEFICSIGVPRFCHCAGPYHGAALDPTIFTQTSIQNQILPNEAILADKIYKGNRITFLSPLPGHRYVLNNQERAYNYLIYRARQCVERLISRLRIFGILNVLWRFSLSFHELLVRVCCKLVNLNLLFEPLG
jgi:hypothetical protein